MATLFWGIVGMSVGLLLAFMFLFPNITDGIPWLSFGRLRPLHTNAVIFAFVGNAIFAGVYYSTQRLLKARMFSDFLSNFNFWGCQLNFFGDHLQMLLVLFPFDQLFSRLVHFISLLSSLILTFLKE